MSSLPPLSSFLSPPEPSKPLDSFDNPHASSLRDQPAQQQQVHHQSPQRSATPCPSTIAEDSNKLPPISPERKNLPPSPPDTPYSKKSVPVRPEQQQQQHTNGQITLPSFRTLEASTSAAPSSAPAPAPSLSASQQRQDPVLYPLSHDSQHAPSTAPLFAEDAQDAEDEAIREHIALRKRRERMRKEQSPSFADYKVMAEAFHVARRSTIGRQYNWDRPGYFEEERRILDATPRMKQYAPAGVLKRLAPRTLPKKSTTSRRVGGGGAATTSRPSRPQRVRRSAKSTPQSLAINSFGSTSPGPHSASLTPSKPPRTIGTNRDNTHFSQIEDYSPPIESLRGNARGFKADWKGQVLDLSDDPDRHLLDPAELTLASTLRLSCGRYLATKRRLFKARVEALRDKDKPFRKTDAQQACRIDVNKASKLWAAYDRVGWLDRKWFEQYL